MHVKTIQPGQDGLVRLKMAGGALLEAPIHLEHDRATNYLAVIDVNPTMPGGLGRYFIDKGRGDCLYIVEQVRPFDAVECAADYTTSVGRRYRNRWYGVVLSKTETEMVLKPFAKGTLAVLESDRLVKEHTPQMRVPT